MGYKESRRNHSVIEAITKEKGFKTSGVELEAVEISMGVVFLDKLDDVVTRGSERDVVRHAGMQDGNELAFSVEDGCARVAFSRKVAMLLAEVEDCDLPGIMFKLVTCISLQL